MCVCDRGHSTPPRTTHSRGGGGAQRMEPHASPPLPQVRGSALELRRPLTRQGPWEGAAAPTGHPRPPPAVLGEGALLGGGGGVAQHPHLHRRNGAQPPPSRSPGAEGPPLQSQTLSGARGRRGTPLHAWGYGEAGTPRRGRVTCPEQPVLEINERRWERAGHAPSALTNGVAVLCRRRTLLAGFKCLVLPARGGGSGAGSGGSWPG